MILSLSGLKGSGKDAVASFLIRKYKFTRISLADPLKEVCARVINKPIDIFHNVAIKDKNFDIALQFDDTMLANLAFELNSLQYDVTPSLFSSFLGTQLRNPREVLTFIGTDLCRKYVDNDIWLKLAKQAIENTEGNIVVTDSRFANERNMIKNLRGILAFVDRPSVTQSFDRTSAHESETDQLNESYNVYINNNDSLNSLEQEIDLWYNAKRNLLR